MHNRDKKFNTYFIVFSIITIVLLAANFLILDMVSILKEISTARVVYTDFDKYSEKRLVDYIYYQKGDKDFTFRLKPDVIEYVRDSENIKTSERYSSTAFQSMEENLGLVDRSEVDKIVNAQEQKLTQDGSIDYTAILKPEMVEFIKSSGLKDLIFVCTYPDYDEFTHDMLSRDILVDIDEKENETSILSVALSILPLVFLFLIYKHVFKTMSGDGKFSLKEKDILLPEKPDKGFDMIGGHWETKKELSDIIELINNRDIEPDKAKYIPKGYLFTGPPGTGKTALARAVAHETNCNFLYVCASDFTRFYVGQGAANVRKLMDTARNNAPCIVFLDEIDSLGKRGGKGGGGSDNENDQTLNTLLTEIDGFKSNKDIIFIGATNFEENVDPALIRAGRLGRKIRINLPEVGERIEILNIYLNDIKCDDSVDVKVLAEQTAGFSGADLENLVKTAVLETIINNTEYVTSKDFDESFFKIIMKGNKRYKIDPELQEKRSIVAYHESGHTLGHYLFEKTIPVKVSIIPSTSGAGGVTISTPAEVLLQSKRFLMNQVKVLYCGRIAEEYLLKSEDDITVGAQQDIKEATKILYQIVNYFGMNGSLINYDVLDIKDSNIKQMEELAKRLYDEAKKAIYDNGEMLSRLAHELLEKESMEKVEIEEILTGTSNPDINQKIESELVIE